MVTLFINEIRKKIHKYKPIKRIISTIGENSFHMHIRGAESGFLGILLSYMKEHTKRSFFVIASTEKEADSLASDISLAETKVIRIPAWENAAYSGVSENSPVFGQRAHALRRMMYGEGGIYIVSLKAVVEGAPPVEYTRKLTYTLKKGDSIDPVDIGELLSSFGYERVPRVTLHGEYALRGEVLDFYLPGAENPYRIVFDFDVVEEVRSFDSLTQNTVEDLDHVIIYPHREVIWDEKRISVLAEQLENLPEFQKNGSAYIKELWEKKKVKGEEYLYPLAFDTYATFLDYMPEQSTYITIGGKKLETSFDSLKKEYTSLYRKKRREKEAPHPDRILAAYPDMMNGIERSINFPMLSTEDSEDNTVRINCDGPRSFFGNVNYLKEEISNRLQSGYKILILAESESQASRINYLLKDYEVNVIPGGISGGFSLPDVGIMVIQENEIFGRKRRIQRSTAKAKTHAIDSFVDLDVGDLVVHVNYGIGRFKGIDRIKVMGRERDYIKIEYAGQESIYIPLEQVNLVQKYIGQDGGAPKLDKIGGKSWQNRKKQVQKAVEDLAERLIRLYSKRRKARGYAFQKDTDWQMEFEAAFPYEETPDQIQCIDDVKNDMESPQPMDRLVCGDVGYGKTEIALRAAFKAVTEGKQVVFLAPTTILVEQHFENLQERMANYPIKAAMLSRFISKAEQKRVLSGIKEGSIDIVVGTHRILQKDIHFKELGLLIIDEEQRFGVKAKEKLKELKTSVDTLALTATPIPRTLHMSLMKIRDMSVLNTPPHNRLPIRTEVMEFDEEIVQRAIRKEVERGGQVFFLHNRVNTLEETRRFLERLVPEVIIESAHGQMNSHQLEDVMHRFIHGSFQVLVSTTIIENGIDIPNVNTIIIDRADMYGVSQLYQLKGRVGRSDREGAAYLLYPKNMALSEKSMKRLKIISDYTELGSGFKIAMKDLEVRGAGNLLGKQQHGEIMAVGFDMYLRLLDEAMAKLNEEKEEKPPEVYLELDYSGYIPDDFISEPVEKMRVYKDIAGISTEQELERVSAMLEDHYGPLPEEVISLLSIAEIRILCRQLYISSVKERKGVIEIEFAKVNKVNVDRVIRLMQESGGKVQLDPARPQILRLKTPDIGLKEKSEFLRDTLSNLV